MSVCHEQVSLQLQMEGIDDLNGFGYQGGFFCGGMNGSNGGVCRKYEALVVEGFEEIC